MEREVRRENFNIRCRRNVIRPQNDRLRYYASYKLSYRDIEEILAERGSHIDHSTINRWVINFAPMLEFKARQIKRPVSSSWRMDETYIKIKGEWWYYYRAIDKFGDVVDFYLSKERDEKAAQAFIRKAINTCVFRLLSTLHLVASFLM